MANSLTDVTPYLTAAAVKVLRTNSVVPRLVNRDIEAVAMQQGSSVNVPIPGSLSVTDVAPSNVIPAPQNLAPTTVPIELNKWKKVDFSLTDKERKEIVAGYLPRQAEEAVVKLAKYVDEYLLGKYVAFYGSVGTAGTTPFANEKPTDAAQLRRVLNNQLAPMSPRHVVFNADAEANALSVEAFANASWHGDPEAILKGKLNERLGFQWWMDQNVAYHTTGSAAGWALSANEAAGETIISISGGTGTFTVGDLVTFANHATFTYTVLGSTSTTLTVRPPLRIAVPSTTVVASKASHAANIGFHPDAFAFAVRTLEDPPEGLGVQSQTVLDDVSGLAIRLIVRYEHYMTIWSFDILFGGEVVRPELGARLLG